MTKQIFSDVQNDGYLLIICKKEHLKYKMAKNSCQLVFQISTHICKLVKSESFRTQSIHEDRKSHKNLLQSKLLLKQTTYLLLEGRKNFPFYCRFSLSHHHQNHSKNKVKSQRNKKKMNIQTVSQRFRSEQYFVQEIFRDVLYSNL